MQIPRYTGDRQCIDYSAVQRQQMWSNTASDSIPQHNRDQYGNRNIVQTPTQQPFLALQSLNLNVCNIKHRRRETREFSTALDLIQV
jgi:hypothetical protein